MLEQVLWILHFAREFLCVWSVLCMSVFTVRNDAALARHRINVSNVLHNEQEL